MANEPPPVNIDTSKEEYQATLASIRHYSNSRGAFFTVYIAGTSGLVFALSKILDLQSPIPTEYRPSFLAIVIAGGLSFTVIFWLMDALITGYISRFSHLVESQWPGSHWAYRPLAGRWAHRPAWLLYLCCWSMWIWLTITFFLNDDSPEATFNPSIRNDLGFRLGILVLLVIITAGAAVMFANRMILRHLDDEKIDIHSKRKLHSDQPALK